MRVYCPDCDTPRTVSNDWVGRRVRCRGCDRPFRVGARNQRREREPARDDIDPARQRTAAWILGSALLLIVGLIVGGGLTGWYVLRHQPDLPDPEEIGEEPPWPDRPAGDPPEFDQLPGDPE